MARQFRDVDDIDGVNDAVTTKAFSVGGKNYEIDLSEAHVQQFDAEFASWIRHARRAGSPPRQLPRTASSPVSTEADWWVGPECKELRQVMKAWGTEHGFDDLGAQGRLPRALAEKWLLEVCDGDLSNIERVLTNALAKQQG
jgi:hypothetical protein